MCVCVGAYYKHADVSCRRFFLVAFESLFVVALFHIYNRSMYIIYFGFFFTPTNIKKK